MIVKKNPFFERIVKDDSSPWMKLPYWAIPLFRKFGLSDIDISVLVFLIINIDMSLGEVYAPTRVGVKYVVANKSTYYRAIDKLKQVGLRKIGNGVYDLSNLADTLSALRIINNIPLEKDEEETEDA